MNIIRYILSATWFKELAERLFSKSPKFFVALRWITGFIGSLVGVAVFLNDIGTLVIPDWIIDNIQEIIIGLSVAFGFTFTPVKEPQKLSTTDDEKGEGGPGPGGTPTNPPKP